MSIWQFIKNILKRILPPPTKSFMREMEELKQQLTQINDYNTAIQCELNRAHEENAELQKKTEALFFEISGIHKENAELQKKTETLFSEISGIHKENAELRKNTETVFSEISGIHKESAELQEKSAVLLTEISGIREENISLKKVTSQIREENNVHLGKLSGLNEAANKKIDSVAAIGDRIYKALPGKPVYWHNEFERSVVKANWGAVTESPDFKEKFLRLIDGLDAESIRILTRILARQKQFLSTDSKELDLFTREEQEEMRLLNENFQREIFKVSEDLYAYRNYLLPVNHFEPSVFYFRYGIDELKTDERVKGKAVLDVGGYIGDSALILEELDPQVIYTFEADPGNYKVLQETLELNGLTNVVPVPFALGDHVGTTVFHTGGSCSGTVVRGGIPYEEEIEVPLTTLDTFVEEHPMEIGLIKVDIEGAEPYFLEGAKKTICEQRPILLLSIYHNAHDFFELKPMIENWNLGYSLHIHKPTFGNATGETLLIAEII